MKIDSVRKFEDLLDCQMIIPGLLVIRALALTFTPFCKSFCLIIETGLDKFVMLIFNDSPGLVIVNDNNRLDIQFRAVMGYAYADSILSDHFLGGRYGILVEILEDFQPV